MIPRFNCSYSVTVFTPTYNRAHTLPQLYASLKRQTSFDFEWIIVDDGSIDNTEGIVAEWLLEDTPFDKRYIKKENGGKHRAINEALPLAEGELFFIVDSDDYLSNTAIETLIKRRNSLPLDDDSYAGVAGCKGYHSGEMIGTSFLGDMLDCTSLERSNYGIEGDKAEAFFTSILRHYPFPEFDGEKFVTEALVWDRMALDGYRLRYFNEVIYLCEYLEDGLSHQGLELYYRNPIGYGRYLQQCRRVNKFGKGLQRYFDVECYLHWRKDMRLREITELIGTKPVPLLTAAGIYRLRQIASKCKQYLLGYVKGRKKK